jgi:uncharacterized protein (DUF885 family)
MNQNHARVLKCIVGLMIGTTLTPAPPGAEPAAESLQSIARAAYEKIWEFDPVVATYQGFHRFDGNLASYTPQTVADEIKALKIFLGQIEKFNIAALTPDDRLDYELLVSNLKIQLFWLEQYPAWQKNPKLYADECVQGVYYLLLRNFSPLSVRAQDISRRLAQVPRALDEARTNIKDPPRTYVTAAISELETGEEFFAQITKELGDKFPALQAELAENGVQAIAAMKAYRSELEQALPGLNDNFALGKDNYNFLLRTDHCLSFDADSLLRLGENLYEQTDSLINVLTKAREIYQKLQPPPKQPVLRPPKDFSKKDIFAGESAMIDSMKAWVSNRSIATVPRYVGRLEVTETPTFLRSIIPGLAMEPPAPLDSIQTSFIYIPPIPDPLDSAAQQDYYTSIQRGYFRGGIVHEGYPGHHFQLSIANHHPSFIRKLQGNTHLIEGWALYCEQMVVDEGLYPDDGFLPLRWLGGVRFRAVRIILDVKLQTGNMTFDDAWRFMVEKTGADSSFAQGEVRRYCLSPTQPMSYLVGKTLIMELRDTWQRKLGAEFSLKDFHDRLLAEGSIPVSLIQKKLLGE